MSIWLQRKDRTGRPAIYSVSIPWELLLILVGIISVLIMPRYLFDKKQLLKDSIFLSSIGFFLFLISKASTFSKGYWQSWGAKYMSTPFKYAYYAGYVLMIIGIFLALVYAVKA